jgi:uncharacterized protein
VGKYCSSLFEFVHKDIFFNGDTLKLWIDADACPREIMDIILKCATRNNLHVTFVANKYLNLPKSPLIDFILVPKGLDVADGEIVRLSSGYDIVVTQDIPLAYELVQKGILAIDPRGQLHTAESISERRSIRDFMTDLRSSGVVTGGPRPFDAKSKQNFANTLDSTVTKRLKLESKKEETK